MADTSTKKYKIKRVVDIAGNTEVLHPETDAGQVIYQYVGTDNKLVTTTVEEQLGELKNLAEGSGVTGVKGDAESTYRKGNVNLTADDIGAVKKNATIEGGTATKVTYDSKGLVTGGGNATLDDIADGSTRKLSNYIPTSQKGVANGVATLGTDGKVPTSQLPSYVDDVLSYATFDGFPNSGEAGKIYVAEDTNKTYRWSGSSYVEISASLALGETPSTAYAGDKGAKNRADIEALSARLDKKVFWVTFSGNTTNKTYNEIRQAVANGDIVVGKDVYGEAIYQLSYIDVEIEFQSIENIGGNISVNTAYVATDNTVVYSTVKVTNTYVVEFVTSDGKNFTTKQKYQDIEQAIQDGEYVVGKDSFGLIYQCFAENDDDQIVFSRVLTYGKNAQVTALFVQTDNTVLQYTVSTLTGVSDTGSGVIVTKVENNAGTVKVTRRDMNMNDLPTPIASDIDALYTAIKVNTKGIVTQGGKVIEFGAKGSTPSSDLMIGGLFFELVE